MTEVISTQFRSSIYYNLGLPITIFIPIVGGVMKAPVSNIDLTQVSLPIRVKNYIEFDLTLFCKVTVRLYNAQKEIYLHQGSNLTEGPSEIISSYRPLDCATGNIITLSHVGIFQPGDAIYLDVLNRSTTGYWNLEII